MVSMSLPTGCSFLRIDSARIAKLDSDWEALCARYGEDYSDYAAPSLEHVRKISSENPPDKRYGIYGLEESGSIEAIVHVNHASLPGPSGHTLRVLWALMSPKFDFETLTDDQISHVVTCVMIGVVQLGFNEMRSRYIKFHLGSIPDRGILSGMGRVLESVGIVSGVAIRGNWLHMNLVGN